MRFLEEKYKRINSLLDDFLKRISDSDQEDSDEESIFSDVDRLEEEPGDMLDEDISLEEEEIVQETEDVILAADDSLPKEEETTPSEETVELSLLDNKDYLSLAEQCRFMYDELDRMEKQTSSEELLNFIAMQKSRVRESLFLSGASLIDEEAEFNLLRHEPYPMTLVKNGTTIAETLEPGIAIEDRVLIKAKVRIEQ